MELLELCDRRTTRPSQVKQVSPNVVLNVLYSIYILILQLFTKRNLPRAIAISLVTVT